MTKAVMEVDTHRNSRHSYRREFGVEEFVAGWDGGLGKLGRISLAARPCRRGRSVSMLLPRMDGSLSERGACVREGDSLLKRE